MAVILGFDLSEMRWSAFNRQQMFDRKWYLRRERFILYQIAMLVSLAAECTATYSLSKYKSLQAHVYRLSSHSASINETDLYVAACVTITSCVLVATLFGADFFFLLFWPRRSYAPWYNTTKRALAVVILIGMAISALMSTIVVASHTASVSGVDSATARALLSVYARPPLTYRDFPPNIAWIVLICLAFVSTTVATVVMFMAVAHERHDKKHGAQLRTEEVDNSL